MLSLIFIVEQPRCSHRHDVNSFNREIAVFNLLHPRLSCHSLNLEYANGQPAFFNALRVNFIESRMAGNLKRAGLKIRTFVREINNAKWTSSMKFQ